MPLTMRPTGLQSPVDKHLKVYTIYSGDWPMGRIYEERGAREELRWYCSFFGILAKPSDVRTDGRAPTLEAAKADFEASWRKWLAWVKLGEIQQVAGGHGQKTTRATINRARQTNHDAISGSAVAGNR